MRLAFLIDAHGLDVQAQGGLFEHDGTTAMHTAAMIDGGGHGADVAAEHGEGVVADVDDQVVAQQQADGPGGGPQNQGGHHGLDVQIGHQAAVEGAAQAAHQQGGHDAHARGMATRRRCWRRNAPATSMQHTLRTGT